jgi:hypothetical protein
MLRSQYSISKAHTIPRILYHHTICIFQSKFLIHLITVAATSDTSIVQHIMNKIKNWGKSHCYILCFPTEVMLVLFIVVKFWYLNSVNTPVHLEVSLKTSNYIIKFTQRLLQANSSLLKADMHLFKLSFA